MGYRVDFHTIRVSAKTAFNIPFDHHSPGPFGELLRRTFNSIQSTFTFTKFNFTRKERALQPLKAYNCAGFDDASLNSSS
jgi:hypothetical protein